MTLPILRSQLDKAQGHRAYLVGKRETTLKAVTENTGLMQAQEKAQAFIQTVAMETQNQLKLTIEDLVQSAIDAVFPLGTLFKVDYEMKRGTTEATMYLEQDGDKMNPLEDDGGGLCDVLAFALRLVAWTLGNTDNVLLLDEPFKNISKEYKAPAMEMLKGLSSKLKIQSIIVTHDDSIIDMADKVFNIALDKERRAIVKVLS